MAAVIESPCLQAALEYAGMGWRVVPIRSGGKAPWVNAWQQAASDDAETLERWWSERPDSGVGIKLGPDSGIIDIECDDMEAEKKLAELFEGVELVTASYAAKRGKHRLFKWRDDLPHSDKAVFKIGALEFRTGAGEKGAQSVFPPSTHPDGGQYKWLVHPDDGGIAHLPDHVIARLWNWCGEGPEPEFNGKAKRPPEHWQRIAGGVGEGARNADAASLIGGLLRGLNDLNDSALIEVAYQAAASINERNRPPLSDKELKGTFASILRREQQRRTAEAAEGVLAKSPEQRIEEAASKGIKVPKGMKLVIVRSDPPFYELYAPHFKKARGGCIRLTAQQLCSFGALRIQALEQADYPLPDSFRKAWAAKGGLFEQLVFSAEEREASAVTKRLAMAAEYLLGRIDSATPRVDGRDEPDPRKPVRMSDGTVWFRWSDTWKDGVFDGAIAKEDPKRMADALGLSAQNFTLWPHRGDKRRRYVVISKELVSRIESMAEMAQEEIAQTTPIERDC